MDQLQELDRKFDIAQAAHAQLELAVLELRGNIGQHAAAHGLYVLNKGLALRRRPHHRSDLVQIVLA